jgi:hypothetical protein
MTVTRILPTSGSGAAYMAKVKEEVEALWAAASCPLTGAAGTNTITAQALYPLDANRAGQKFTFLPANANTGAVTLNIDGMGALPLTDETGAALPAGRLSPSRVEQIVNMGAQFRLLASGGSGSAQTLLRAVFALQQPKGTHGGSATGAARTRYPFNATVLNDIPGLSIDTVTNIGRLTVPAGTFDIEARCLFYGTGHGGIYLRNITDAADVTGLVRSSMISPGHAHLAGKATFAVSKQIEIQYYCNNSRATDGLGIAINDGGNAAEQFGWIEFRSQQ